MPSRPLRHAVVAGGSIAGLLAARVLSNHFEAVTLVERDALARTPEPRKGVPQGPHAHILLLRGQAILQSLFPGLAEELCEAGAVVINSGQELAWYYASSLRAQFQNELPLLSMSRPLLEATIAKRVSALPNIRVLERTSVNGFRTDAVRTIRGVDVNVRGSARTKEIEADLVIDATGRGSATPRWLPELGFDAPEAELVPARVTYASCTFQQPERKPKWRALAISGSPPKRVGVIFPIEGDRWLVSLGSFFDEPTPRDHSAVLVCAQSLAIQDLYEAIRNLEPRSDVVRYRFSGSQRRRYERLNRFPEGLIVVGDAVCSFNPVYGQGMTVSAIEAECLDQVLARAKCDGGLPPEFGLRWFRTIKPVVGSAWDGALLEDFRFPELAGERPPRLKPLQWYMDRVHRATHRSPAVSEQFYRVAGLLDPPSALFRPRILADIFFGGLRTRPQRKR